MKREETIRLDNVAKEGNMSESNDSNDDGKEKRPYAYAHQGV